MRTTITAIDDRHVSIAFEDLLTGQPVTMDIWAPQPSAGGCTYVRFNGDHQLCDGLSSRGSTLTYRHGTRLVDLVRREYKTMRRADKREAARYA